MSTWIENRVTFDYSEEDLEYPVRLLIELEPILLKYRAERISHIEPLNISNGRVNAMLTFETSQDDPTLLFQEITETFPNQSFYFNYFWFEPAGGGELMGLDGVLENLVYLEDMTTHKEFETLNRLEKCLCAYNSEPSELYDDCPR